MLFENVRIEAVAYELGPEPITSTDLEEQFSETLARLKIQPGILESLSGIRERRFWPFGTKPSQVATMAARKVIEISGVDPHKIGCMINTSVFRDYIEPSTASLIHGNLRLPDSCLNYDLGNACLGFVNGIFNVAMMIESQMIKHGLVVAGEAGRDMLESTIQELRQKDISKAQFMENIATLTLGEGAVAMVLSHRDVASSNHRVNGAVSLSATEHSRLCVASPTLMRSYPSKLLVAGANLIAKTWKLATKTLERWNDDQIDLYAAHQVSTHNTRAVIRAIGIKNTSKVKLTFPWLGNTGPVGLPTALALAGEEGQLKEGDHIGMVGVGSGLNCMLMSVTW